MLLIYFNKDKIDIRYIVTLCVFIGLINGFPIEKKDSRFISEQDNEKTYPNGTVVGKYHYKDKEGNPVHVQYYADNSGYGVELKTVKLSFPVSIPCKDKSKQNGLNSRYHDDKALTTLSSLPDFPISSKPTEEFPTVFKSEAAEKTNSDYEVFVHDVLQTPKKCDQDKIHVYSEQNKRKIRNTLPELDAIRYCEQMFA